MSADPTIATTSLPAHDPPHPRLPAGLPLCVDLDGTLVKSDTLVDSVLALARQNPRALLQVPGWLLRGKAAFKQHVTSAVLLDVTALPYNQPLVRYLASEHAAGRPLYLATAANHALAERVSHHLGLFAGVLASDSALNLAGSNKLAAFQQRFGDAFSYIGNASPDLPILTACQSPMLANPSAGLLSGLRAARVTPVHLFRDQRGAISAWLKALRLHQWAKNALIFLPLLLAHAYRGFGSAGSSLGALLAFLSFGLCASGTYIVNDLLDIEADRRHRTKRRRPFAAGDLSAITGSVAVVCLVAVAFLLALLLPRLVQHLGTVGPVTSFGIARWLLLYAVSTLTYSFALKRVVLVDVVVLSGLYTVRILAGSACTGVPITTWLGGFSVFLFLSLAFVKRFAELESLRARGAVPTNGRGYLISDIEQLRAFGTSAAYAAVVVLTLYISDLDNRLYHHAQRLWLLLPIMILWLSQLWLLASRGELNEDPVVYAITDRRSLLLGAVVLAIVVASL